MGAENQDYKVKANNVSELERKYDQLVSQALHMNGHGGYSGSIAESAGLEVSEFEANTEDEAQDYIFSNAKKWDNSIAVRIKNTDTWIIGGCYSS